MSAVSYTMTGVDGSVWPAVGIADCSLATPIRFGDTPDGLLGAPGDHDDTQNVDQAGVTWQSKMFRPNVITLKKIRFGPVPLGEDAFDRYLDYVAAFGDGRDLGEFRVTSFRRGVRRERFQSWRLADTLPTIPQHQFIDSGFANLGDIALRSDESWWRQDPVDISFTAQQFAGAAVPNLSDDDGWAYWEIVGPITNPSIGIASESITILTTIPAGQTWRIDTDPSHFLVRDGANVDRSILKVYWRKKVPRGDSVPLGLGGSGTNANTRIRIVVPQVFRRAL